jgi:hypothetical protein
MQSIPPTVHLVDLAGNPVAELDLTDPLNWPASTDDWFWCVDDATAAELEEAELTALLNDDDAPHPAEADQLWAQMMVEASLPPVCGGAPTPFVPSPQDWADYYANRGD